MNTQQTPITLNPDQLIAVQAMLDFIADPDPESSAFTLQGFAGTGKTFCMREIIARCQKSRVRFAFTAPTNKAAKVLRSVTGEASTIFSLLGLRIDKSGELKKLVTGVEPPDLSEIDVIVVDEGSMVNHHLHQILKDRAKLIGFRVIYLADKAQLPPVGEAESPIFRDAAGASLTKVMRHDNQILTLATKLRSVMNSIAPCIDILNDHDQVQGVWKMSKAEFKKSIYDCAARGEFADGSQSKVIAWRNVTVGGYNDLIRSAIYGASVVAGEYLQGERIVAAAPCTRGEEQLMTTDEEAFVESVVVCKHPLEPKYQAFELKCRTEGNKSVRLLVLHPSSKEHFERDSMQLAHDAKAMPKLWKKFWEHKELFHDIKYAYALTAHRSQGSTYTNVWVDYQDVLKNQNRKEAFQCLYVAATRPTTKLMLA